MTNAAPGIADYVAIHGTVDAAAHQLVARAHTIFERVVRVADLGGKRRPVLVVLDSDTRPWAIAMPSGHIALSRGAVEFCFEGVSHSLGDARLAFVLGHEIAHFTSDDFWHRDVSLALAGTDAARQIEELNAKLSSQAWFAKLRETELRADDRGFVYASLAGFHTRGLIEGATNDGNFLAAWVRQTRSLDDRSHQAPRARFNFLASRFERVQRLTTLFDFGFRLARRGRLDESLLLLEEFRTAFPSREVLNNIGFVHLQLARRMMSSERRTYYWLPMMLESQSGLDTPTRGLDAEDRQAILAALGRAVRPLEAAVEDDPKHLASRINLAVAYLYRGDIFKARALVEEALDIDPGNAELLGLRALILLEQEEDVDMWPVAVNQLRKGYEASNSPMLRYNLARVLEERGRSGQARQHWKHLAGLKQQIPEPYRSVVCRRSNSPCPDPGERRHDAVAPPGGDVPLGAGLDSEAAKAFLASWQRTIDRDLDGVRITVFRDAASREVLALDDHLEMLVLPGHEHVEESVSRCCGPRTSMQRLASGDAVWNYAREISVLVRHGRIAEIWRAL